MVFLGDNFDILLNFIFKLWVIIIGVNLYLALPKIVKDVLKELLIVNVFHMVGVSYYRN